MILVQGNHPYENSAMTYSPSCLSKLSCFCETQKKYLENDVLHTIDILWTKKK